MLLIQLHETYCLRQIVHFFSKILENWSRWNKVKTKRRKCTRFEGTGTRKALYIFLEHCIERKTDCSVWNGKFSVCVHYIIHSSISKARSGRHLQGTMGAAVLFQSLRPRLPISSDSTLSPRDWGSLTTRPCTGSLQRGCSR